MKTQAAGGLAALLSTSALLLGTVAITPASAQSTSGRTLIIDNSFVLVTADPGHMYEHDRQPDRQRHVRHAGHLQRNGNFKNVVPHLATSYQTLNGGRKYVFHLNPTAKFSDGTP